MKKIMTYAAGMVSLGLLLPFSSAFGQAANPGSDRGERDREST